MARGVGAGVGAGVANAAGAGLLWGMIFVVPLLLPHYPGIVLSFGRYLAFGLIAAVLALFALPALRSLQRADWLEALKLSLVGNIIYYATLASAIQLAGAPVPTLLIGTLPVVIAVTSNLLQRGTGQVAWRHLAPALMAILSGLACVNMKEVMALSAGTSSRSVDAYAFGVLLALIAVASWTWYPIRNGAWLKANPGHTSATWATAQGLTTLPLALLGFLLLAMGQSLTGKEWLAFPLGPTPVFFVGLMLAIGFGASWLGTLLWNRASQLLPTSLSGQLIVFETLAALVYVFVWYRRAPTALELTGITLLIGGVVLGVRAFQQARQ